MNNMMNGVGELKWFYEGDSIKAVYKGGFNNNGKN